MHVQRIHVQRIFFPVGQGAYYMERIGDNFVSIYDCGKSNKSRKDETKVKWTLREGAQVDVLFISHFDADHVNLIPTLKDHVQIKRVILPLTLLKKGHVPLVGGGG